MGDARPTRRNKRPAPDRPADQERARESDRRPDHGALTADVVAGHIALFLGTKRSGKSTLASGIASRFDRVYAEIPREEDVLPNSRLCRSDDEVKRAIREGVRRISYMPRRDELPRLRDIVDGHLELLLGTGMAWCILIHEGGDVADERDVRPAMSEIIRQGSAHGWVVLWLYQRCLELPRILTNNLDWVFLFAMGDPEELKRAAALVGSAAVRERPLGLPFRYDLYVRAPDGRVLYVDQQKRTARLVVVLPARTTAV